MCGGRRSGCGVQAAALGVRAVSCVRAAASRALRSDEAAAQAMQFLQ
jgi:hypothetical protein